MMDESLPYSARIQQSWGGFSKEIIRYEDLLKNDFGLLEKVLIDKCKLPVTRERLREIVQANRFTALNGGRLSGQEDPHSHERKGISGDWQNYFTPRVTEAFKSHYADLLISTGYEQNHDW